MFLARGMEGEMPVGFSMVGTLIAVFMLLPSLVFFTWFPPIRVPHGLRESNRIFTILEKAGQVGSLVFLAISKDFFPPSHGSTIVMLLMVVCIVIYYGLWFRYLKDGQSFASLYKPFMIVPIPLAVFPVLAFGFAAWWGQCVWLGVSTALLAIGHWTVSYTIYRQL